MKKICFMLFIFILLFLLTGCWNYREINFSLIVSGVAIDKNDDNSYHLTAEIVDVGGSTEQSELISMKVEADSITLLDGIRKMIKVSGRRLFWSHAKVIIISQDVAKDGILPILELFSRNDELRFSIYPLVSKEKTAKEILQAEGISTQIISYEITGIIEENPSQISISSVNIKDFVKSYSAEGISGSMPSIEIIKNEGKNIVKFSGLSAFKGDKLVGFLDDRQTKDILFIQDEIEYGMYPIIINKDTKNNITLEIIKNKTSIKPIYKNGRLKIDIDINTQVGIASLGSNQSSLDENSINEINKLSEKQLKQSIEDTIKEIQTEYGVDVFGFGSYIKADIPKIWKKIGDDWENHFKDLEVSVKVRIDITTTSYSNKSIKQGD